MTTKDKQELSRLCDIVGSLMISQFDNQEQYRDVINVIFDEWVKQETITTDKRNTLAIQLGERTGLDIQGSEVMEDDKWVYYHNPEYPDEVERYEKPLPMIAEPWDDIPYEKSPFNQ
tara:strand:- start:430 stop:780 length:351 start_codon:yes stop_codon:yes gene_type:complete